MSRITALTRPGGRASSGRRPKVAERDVLRACLDLLAVKKILAFRMNTGAHVAQNASGKSRFIRYGVKGMADVLALPKIGVRITLREEAGPLVNSFLPLWVEVKASDGKQSYDQQLFQHIVEAEGHQYLICRDVDQLAEWLKERGR